MNAMAAMAIRTPDWPPTLAESGHELYWVAPRFNIQSPPSPIMNPDLLFRSLLSSHALVVEAKSGSSLKRAQLENAQKMTPSDVVVQAAVTFNDPTKVSFTYVIACLEAGEAEIVARLDDWGYDFPVIRFNEYEVRLVRGALKDSTLDGVFRAGVALPKPALYPTGLIPIDSGSSMPEVAAMLIVHIIREVVAGKPHFELGDLLRGAVPVWDRFHPNERKQLQGAALRLIRKLRAFRGGTARFDRIIGPAGIQSAPNLYTITNRTEDADQRTHSYRYETLHGWANAFLASIDAEALPPVEASTDEGTQAAYWTQSTPD